MKKIIEVITKIIQLLPEIMVTIGLSFIIYITFCINITAGYYLIGSIFLGLGLFMAWRR